MLDPEHVQARAAWAKTHLKNHWKEHVDLDEKWFYVSSGRGRLKLPADVEKPKQRRKSKRFVAKIMILTAVTRPRPGFNGVVGCWRVTEPFVYKRKTVYQGTTYLAGQSRPKDCEMDGDKFANMLLNNVFPAIRSKLSDAKDVKVQFDNAGGHGMSTIEGKIAREMAAPVRRGKQVGPKLTMVKQCAQSPDTNVCDLGFFNSLDSRLPKLRPYNLDEFEKLIVDEHEQYPAEKMDALFDSKQRVCQAILRCGGDNSYKMPHRRAGP